MKKSLLAVPVAMGVLLVASPAVINQVEASEININQESIDYSTIYAYFAEFNVPVEKQEILLSKIKNGEQWDCYNPEKIAQIPESFYDLDPLNFVQEKVYVFEDGSTTSVSLEVPQEQQKAIEARGSQNINGGIDYWDIKISKTIGTLSAYFYADFFLSQTTGKPSYINDVWGGNVSGFGVVSEPTTTIQRKTEDISKSRSALAYSKWMVQGTVNAGWGAFSGSIPYGSTCNLYLALIRGKVHVSPTLPY